MPGSLSNPAVLDPWQAIVEVGWPRTPTHVALEFILRPTVTGVDVTLCEDGTEDPPPAVYGDDYATQISYQRDLDLSYARRNDVWSVETIVHTIPAQSAAYPFDAWEIFTPLGLPGSSNLGRWTPSTGDPLAIPTPNGDVFTAASTAQAETLAVPYSGGPICVKSTESLSAMLAELSGDTSSVASWAAQAVDVLPTIIANVAGSAFRLIGIHTTPRVRTFGSAEFNCPLRIVLLGERVEE
jgi:hypothetical protein